MAACIIGRIAQLVLMIMGLLNIPKHNLTAIASGLQIADDAALHHIIPANAQNSCDCSCPDNLIDGQ